MSEIKSELPEVLLQFHSQKEYTRDAHILFQLSKYDLTGLSLSINSGDNHVDILMDKSELEHLSKTISYYLSLMKEENKVRSNP
jgi:hypothetical protein